MRDVTIKVALNGYVVRVDCQRIVFSDCDQMIQAIKDYLKNPEEVEAEYIRTSMNAKQLGFLSDSMNANQITCGRLNSEPLPGRE